MATRDFGIKVTLIEPGGFSTDWGGASAKRTVALDAYEHVDEASRQRRAGNQRGDPVASAEAVMRIVDAEEPPLRVFFGSQPLAIPESDCQSRLST